jgi:hypothetical protein
MRHNPKVDMLRDMGGGIVAFGRWVALMSILYDSDGLVDVGNDARRRYLMRELELDGDGLDEFLAQCAECDLIQPEMLEMGHVISHGVCDELDYRKQKSEAGKKGNEKRWKGANR